MARRLQILPDGISDEAFAVSAGLRAGLSPKQLRNARFETPFSGVRSSEHPVDVTALARSYAVKMRPGSFFSHVTAAVLNDIWLPLHLERAEVLDVAVHPGARAPRDRRVRGHHLIERPGLVWERNGLRVANPIETWCQLATVLGMLDLIVAGECLLGKGRPRPVALHELVAAVAVGDRPRQRMLNQVLSRLRTGVRSPWETVLRLLLVDAGLPEPEINGLIFTDEGQFIAESDLVYRRQRVLIEYEGEYHFGGVRQARKDITRYERLQELGWRVIRVTVDDIRLHPEETIARVRTALAGAR